MKRNFFRGIISIASAFLVLFSSCGNQGYELQQANPQPDKSITVAGDGCRPPCPQ
jgi:hypothetical protein